MLYFNTEENINSTAADLAIPGVTGLEDLHIVQEYIGDSSTGGTWNIYADEMRRNSAGGINNSQSVFVERGLFQI
jgi:hypothetical protein